MLIFIKKNFFWVNRKKCCLCCLIAPQSRINSGFLQGNKSPKSVALLLPCCCLVLPCSKNSPTIYLYGFGDILFRLC